MHRRRTLSTAWLLALIPGVLASCDDALLGQEPPLVTGCRRDPPLDYENFGRGFLGKHCTGCHSAYVREDLRSHAPLDVNLDTYDDVVTWAERIRVRSIDSTGMPPAGTLSEDEKDLLDEWLSCEVGR